MKKISLSVALILCALTGVAFAKTAAPSAAANEAAAICPHLPAKSGLTWKHTTGPDFDVCRAMRGDQQVFGVYLGQHPSYLHEEKNKAETSHIGPYEVTWYNASPDEKQGAYARDTLISFGESESDGVAHVWISAANAEEFAATLKILEGVTFDVKAAAEKADPAPEKAEDASGK